MLLPRIEVYYQSAVIVPRVLVVHPLFHVDVHAADGINNLGEGVDVDEHIMLHLHAQKVLHRALCQLVAAVGIGGIDFIEAMPLDFYPGIPRNGQDGCLFLLGVQGGNHQRIGASYVSLTLIHAHQHDNGFITGCHHFSFLGNGLFIKKAGGGKNRSCCCCNNEGKYQQDDGQPIGLFLPLPFTA